MHMFVASRALWITLADGLERHDTAPPEYEIPEVVREPHREDAVRVFDLPGAERFGINFCPTCGSGVPRWSPKIGLYNMPAGSLDGDPGIRPSYHIHVGSKAPWFEITDDLPRYAEGPPPSGR